jgi:acetoin utilization protein AcuB
VKVGSIMTRSPVTVGLDDDLAHVRDLFTAHGFRHLLVLAGGRLVGVLSDRDLLRALSPFLGRASERAQDVATLRRRVHQVMSREPVVVSPEATVAEAARLLFARRVSCLPVVADDGAVVGIVSWRDLLAALVTSG